VLPLSYPQLAAWAMMAARAGLEALALPEVLVAPAGAVALQVLRAR